MSDTLTKGSTGEAVKLLQKALNYHMGTSIVVDGDYGPGTVTAVKNFQVKNGLAPTGTYANLEQLILDPIIDTKMLSGHFIDMLAPTVGVKASVLKAFTDVESKGSGFLANRQPVILFEGHVFFRELAAEKSRAYALEIAAKHPDICYEKWTKDHYLGGVREYERLNKAVAISKRAAWSSASWGLFQIMGNNHAAAGYPSVEAYVNDMFISEVFQFKALLKFIVNYPNKVNGKKLHQALKELDWPTIAEIYNGSGYKANKYDEKLEKAEKSYR